MNATPKPRWGRYSLRTLLVLVTIASTGFGWLGVQVRAKQREREAVKAIRELGGDCYYAHQFHSDDNHVEDAIKSAIPPGPGWLRKFLGDDFFAEVIVAQFGHQTTDADLRNLAPLAQLESVYLDKTQVTDEGIASLQGLTKLKRLSIPQSKVTDAGVERLTKALPNLTIISWWW